MVEMCFIEVRWWRGVLWRLDGRGNDLWRYVLWILNVGGGMIYGC